MVKEYLEIFDENNNTLNKSKERSIVHKQGLWHREVCIWIINEKNQVLIQKRASTKILGANKWSLCAGHVIYGESLIEGAVREVMEEVGIPNLSPSDLKLFHVRKSEYDNGEIKNNHYKYCYILKTNLKLEDYTIQEEELSEIKYVDLEHLKNMNTEEKQKYTNIFSKDDFKDIIKKLEEKLKDLESEE